MIARILIGAVMLSLALSCAAGEDDEECTYGPDYSETLIPLKNKYPNAHLTKDHRSVVIPLADGEVTVSYTGCLHFGMEITLVSARKTPYARKEAFARAVELVRQFNMVDPKQLEQLLAQGKYQEIGAGVFLVDFPDLDEFAIASSMEHGRATLRISDSCCG